LRFSIPIIDSHVALGIEHHLQLDKDELIRRMDAHGVECAIARPMGGELAVHNREGNDRVLAAGDRSRGLATANPWVGGDAVKELARSRERGAVGLYLHPSRQGCFPTDPIATPLIEFARESRWPIVFHTGTYVHSDVLAVAEVARRNPGMTFVCDCAGFADMWFELPGLLQETKNILLCTSLIWTRAIKVAVDTAGADRVLFGSGEPRDSVEAALRRVERIGLTESQQRAVLRENAVRVFKLEVERQAAKPPRE
jgi:predicted TIM-barrel fold metal-dependent hydrolase